MADSSTYDIKLQVKQAVDIVDLVGGYLQLRREGRAYKAICPWHDDTKPSLQVNPERQSFKCWVCNIGGDIFSFVQRMEGVTFPEALALLAERAGIRLERQQKPATAADDKRVLFQAMAWADEQYHACLLRDAVAEPARKYLSDRGIKAESIARFQLGYSPDDWQWILDRAQNTPFNPLVLEKIGLALRRKQGSGFYDRFKNRVLFPIFDAQARAVGLGGRVLPGAEEAAKYINSPETPLFSKSNLLYGLNVARDAIRKTGVALVMEGYTDCVIAHQFGFENAVAVLGTALGVQQIRLLRRFADRENRIRIVLVLDGDEAGRRRANEMLELFVAENVDLRILTLADELDPCEFLLERGPEAFAACVETSIDALKHAVTTATRGIDLQRDVHAASEALEQLVATIAKAPRLRSDTTKEDRLREEKFLQRLAFDFGLPEEEVRTRVTQLRRKPARSAAAPPPEEASASVDVNRIDPCERELLENLLKKPQGFARAAAVLRPEELACEPLRRVYLNALVLVSKNILPDFERLLLEFDEPEIKNLLVELDERGCSKGVSELEDLLTAFERRRQDQWRRRQMSALKERRVAPDQELEILRQLQQQLEQRERARQSTSPFTDGQDARPVDRSHDV